MPYTIETALSGYDVEYPAVIVEDSIVDLFGVLELPFLFLKVALHRLFNSFDIGDVLVELVLDEMNLIVFSFLVIVAFGDSFIFGIDFIDIAAYGILFVKTFVPVHTH